jgi:aerobic-type carbon monoxide dehydrogenase small subunit (CoxS/CutS family)
VRVEVEINGEPYAGEAEPRTLLSDFIRRVAGLHGTRVGCEHGVCGACTVQLDGEPVRSCLVLAAQADGRSLRTIEGLADGDRLHPLQRAFHEAHALQCGYCTAGILISLEWFLRERPDPSDEQIREALAGNLCRCTGYQAMVEATRRAAAELAAATEGVGSGAREDPNGGEAGWRGDGQTRVE